MIQTSGVHGVAFTHEFFLVESAACLLLVAVGQAHLATAVEPNKAVRTAGKKLALMGAALIISSTLNRDGQNSDSLAFMLTRDSSVTKLRLGLSIHLPSESIFHCD